MDLSSILNSKFRYENRIKLSQYLQLFIKNYIVGIALQSLIQKKLKLTLM